MSTKTILRITATVSMSVAMMLSLQGCNLFGALDSPTTEKDTIYQALSDMDDGKCADAVKRFEGMTSLSDDGWHTLGWARL